LYIVFLCLISAPLLLGCSLSTNFSYSVFTHLLSALGSEELVDHSFDCVRNVFVQVSTLTSAFDQLRCELWLF
jgi:uncharacterized membrane protein